MDGWVNGYHVPDSQDIKKKECVKLPSLKEFAILMQLSIQDAKLSCGITNREHCIRRGMNLEACLEKSGKAPS